MERLRWEKSNASSQSSRVSFTVAPSSAPPMQQDHFIKPPECRADCWFFWSVISANLHASLNLRSFSFYGGRISVKAPSNRQRWFNQISNSVNHMLTLEQWPWNSGFLITRRKSNEKWLSRRVFVSDGRELWVVVAASTRCALFDKYKLRKQRSWAAKTHWWENHVLFIFAARLKNFRQARARRLGEMRDVS